MRRITLLFSLLLGLLSNVHAQKAAKARSLLDKVYKTYRNQKDVDMRFDYDLYNEQANVHQKSQGTILVKGGKYALNLMGVERRFDGHKLYTILPEDKEVNISSNDTDQNLLTPDKILSHYRKGYRLSWGVRQHLKGRDIQFIKLRPKHKSDTRYILIGVDAKSHALYKVINIGKKGVVTTLTVTAYKTNQGLPDKRFTFNKSTHPTFLLNYLE